MTTLLLKMKMFPICVVVALVGCATELQPGAEKVRPVSVEQKVGCESLGIVVADQQLGPYKTQNSMNKAINEVARRGGNAIYIMANAPSGIDGVSVTLEALRCK
jgi:hypothetical protein